jgi:hypothetical protein
MTILKIATIAAMSGAIFAAAVPAQAVVTQFASFTSNSDSSIRWQNDGDFGTKGKGGSLYTVSDPTSEVAGSHNVSFSFLQPMMSPFVSAVNAKFTLSATTVESPATMEGGFLSQTVSAGTFSFLSTSDIIVGNRTFKAGSNLLSATFSATSISGLKNTDTGAFGSGVGSTVAYTSDFLAFDDLAELEFGLSLTQITAALQSMPTAGVYSRALRTFRSTSTGSFSSDPAPMMSAIPEPHVWSLLIVGFTMIGLQTRRRSRQFAV